MKRMIVKTLEFLIGVGVIVTLVAGTAAGLRGVPEAPLIGGIFGFVCGLVAAALVFGIVAVLLEIREQLIRIRVVLESGAQARSTASERVVEVPPSAQAGAAS